MTRIRIAILTMLLGLGLGWTACGDDSSGGGGKFQFEVSCFNGIDEDNDGLTDCEDDDCAANPLCQQSAELNCANGVDDDADGATDCDDSDCADNPACASGSELNCANGIDDDADGATDCDDSDCAADPACASGSELNCANGIDDDADGATDCDDPDCVHAPNCITATEANCANGVDDDADGRTDCQDADCTGAPNCTGTLSCGSIHSCMDCCNGWSDQQCRTNCVAAGTPAGQQHFLDLDDCRQAHCAQECADPHSGACNLCTYNQCNAQLMACELGYPSGTGTCHDFLVCTQNCNQPSGTPDSCPSDPDVVCGQNCVENLSPQGYDDYMALVACIYDHCPTECVLGQGDCNSCLQTFCSAEAQRCSQ